MLLLLCAADAADAVATPLPRHTPNRGLKGLAGALNLLCRARRSFGERMRASGVQLLIAGVIIASSSCFYGKTFVIPPPRPRPAFRAPVVLHGFNPTPVPVRRRKDCRHSRSSGEGLVLLARSTRSPEAAAAAAAAPTTPWSRATDVLLDEPAFRTLLAPMGLAGALLGPNLDNYHSAFGVLTYKNPIELSVGGHVLVTTDWWVPPLFAVAGAGIGGLYILFDAALETPPAQRNPAWRDVFLSISVFSFQYYLSGLLTSSGCPYWVLVASLAVTAERVFTVFDGTRAGLWVSIATAVLGPLIEVLLVNASDLYVYNGADIWGVDSWIPVVYFCGGPAVGSLARATYAQIRAAGEDRA